MSGRLSFGLAVAIAALAGCGGGASQTTIAQDSGTPRDARDAPRSRDAHRSEAPPDTQPDAVVDAAMLDAGRPPAPDSAPPVDASVPACTGSAGDGGTGSCYAITCTAQHESLHANRDRLLADLAKRKCTDVCTLWAALNQAERFIFLMDTAYLAAPASLLYPPSNPKPDTALDHAVALYSINGPKSGQGVLFNGLGGNDYNRIYLGFDALGTCVSRNYTEANPTATAGDNAWVKSNDLAGPHAPFTEREMIAWFRALLDLQSQGPQFHHWQRDSDFTQSGLDARLGVCGVTDPTITELTIAFDSVHDSNPLGSYTSDGASNGGTGSQIVDQFLGAGFADWGYMPTTCATSMPVNTSVTGGGTFAGMGPSLSGSACVPAPLGTCH